MAAETSLTTEQIWRAVAAERASLVELLRSLPENDWDRASLCDDWRIRDVVGHLVMPMRPDIGWILVNLIRARGNLARLIRDTAIRHAQRRTNQQLLAELRDRIDSRLTPIGTTPADRLMDMLVHGQDIAIPLGITREMPVAAARSALARVWEMGAPFHAREKFSGYRLVATDGEWAEGGGPVIEGSLADLLLLTTGRHTSARLTGAGAAQWISTQRTRR
ncbi:maleylpyruvate isomerase family mycothiol-dependent enzyme [Nocardia arthritidis]|uniref:Maleylpyruvate isomerase family mycothiol-dependent enzyme n=1 Tax=Nocardia arthritidis TaxID=228602 RepID=A0A6G9YAG1_9NOCA|nr:maleylpyruvate isomerase family mycothiol-dependent enzyme [Nocardia arthritidis]QIS10067.1 maleylpyruvate isomerase family mycothiol-dependent enzyme [Nocardia arthritidis]